MSHISQSFGVKNILQATWGTPHLVISPVDQEDECGWFSAALMHGDVLSQSYGDNDCIPISKDRNNDEWSFKAWGANRLRYL